MAERVWWSSWIALAGQEEAQIGFYARAPDEARRAILSALCEQERWALLARVVLAAGVWPGHAEALAGALRLGRASEPLLWLVWREQGGVTSDRWLPDALLQVMSARGQAALWSLARQPDAPWLTQHLASRADLRIGHAAAPGPFDALWDATPCWSIQEQLLIAAVERPLLDPASGMAVVEALAATERGRWLFGWLMGRLERSDRSWQPAVARIWELAPVSEALCVAIQARQHALIASGCAPAWLSSARAEALSRLRGGELPGLPWSLPRVQQRIEVSGLTARDYVWLMATPAGLLPQHAELFVQTAQLAHDRASGMQLAGMLKAVPSDAASWCAPLWLALTKRPESLVRLELARLIGRLALYEGCGWLEAMLEQTRDDRLGQELCAALRVVGDEESLKALRLARRRKIITPEELSRIEGALATREARPRLQHTAALTQLRALTHQRPQWESLALSPRFVSKAVASQVGLRHNIQWTIWTTPTALAVPLMWGVSVWGVWWQIQAGSSLTQTRAWHVLALQVFLVVCTWRASYLWRMYWASCDDDARWLLKHGDASVGEVVYANESKHVAFVDVSGGRRLIALSAGQAHQVGVGERVNLLYDSGRDDVLLASGLEADRGGQLVPRGSELLQDIKIWVVRLSWFLVAPMMLVATFALILEVLSAILWLLGA